MIFKNEDFALEVSLLLPVVYQLPEIGKNEQDRRSFPFSSVQFSSVQFMNLAHIFADFKFMIVSDCGSYFWPSSVHFLVHLSSHK